MFLVVQRNGSLLIEGIGDRHLERCVQRWLGADFDDGFVQESFVVRPFGISGRRLRSIALSCHVSIMRREMSGDKGRKPHQRRIRWRNPLKSWSGWAPN